MKSFVSKWQKKIQFLFTIVCLIGASGGVYVGYEFFQDRIKIFYVFTLYTLILTFVVIFLGRRLIRMASDHDQ